MGRRATAQIVPRLLTQEQAAEYCGIAVARFVSACPVAAIAMGNDARLKRWDMRQLDEWIDSMRSTAPVSSQDWLDRL